MKTRRIVALLLALVMICGVFAACGKKEEPAPAPSNNAEKQEDKKEETKDFKDYSIADWEALADQLHKDGKDKYKILYMPSWAASEYFVNSYAAWQKLYATEEYGWEIDMIGPKEYTGESQLSTLESALVSAEYDAIILYPIDPATFVEYKNDAFETYKVPLICWGQPQKSDCAQYYVMGDDRYVQEGEYMAKMAIKYVDDNWDYFKKYEETGIPTFFAQQSYNPTQNVRFEGVKKLIEADGRFNVVLDDENVKDAEAINYAEAMLLNHPEVEIGFMYVDVIAFSYDTAIKASDVKLSDHFAIYSCNCIDAVKKLMKEDGAASNIKGSVLSNHEMVGNLLGRAIKLAVPAAQEGLIIEGLSDEQCAAYSNGENAYMVTPENIDEYMNK